MLQRLLTLVLVAAFAMTAHAQVRPQFFDYVRSDLDWYTIETEHFKVHFHADDEGNGSSRTAQVVARIAEEIYGPLTSLYDLEPDNKVSFILKDFEDYSNGAAYFFDDMIEIWAPSLDSPLRGDHNWLRNVITHEFAHIVQVQKTMKANRQMPFLYFQVLDYEDVRRPDVLYGFPNVIATYPVPILNNPAWFAEGTAQYQRAGLHYDRWDTHRDMLLRTRILSGTEFSLKEMGGFYSHTSLGRETVYNHGFAFTTYLANTYGEDVLRRISEALGQWSNWNVERAIKDATGKPGKQVHAEWIATLREGYNDRIADVRDNLVAGTVIQSEGSHNFYPKVSPDGARLAYLSNKGEDFSRTALYIRDLASDETTAYVFDGLILGPEGSTFTCAMGHQHRVKPNISGGMNWRPDGKAMVYAKRKDTRMGHLYADLYVFDLEAEEETRLTTNQRATQPAYSPDGTQLAFIVQNDGTTNLFTMDVATKAIHQRTMFNNGAQVTEPAWHPSGDAIYFGLQKTTGRDLYRISTTEGAQPEAILATSADERSPAFAASGDHVYFTSDQNGIYNLYRLNLAELGKGGQGTDEAAPEKLSNVIGGTFMPSIGPDGTIFYADYHWDGYKIAQLDAPAPVPLEARIASYNPPPIFEKLIPDSPTLAWNDLNAFDDTDLAPMASAFVGSVRRDGQYEINGIEGNDAETEPLEVEPYKNVFTDFSFFPVFRLDQYVSRQQSRADIRLRDRSRPETFWRNSKAGVYVVSREIMNGLSFLGGVLLGPGSRDADSFSDFVAPSNLLKLERDAFIQFDYNKGFGLIPQRWSPQFSVELFNIRRNVENGLTIEEFPCTACFPDSTLADLSYNLWELNLSARSKVNRTTLLEVGYRYSPYRVTTERFFSKELDTTIPESSSRYFIGRAWRAKAYFYAEPPDANTDIVPRGLRAEFTYEYEPGRLLDRFDIEDGFLMPVYSNYKNHRLTLDARYTMRLPGEVNGGVHGFGFRARASTILGDQVDDFFNDYVGGLVGARGYPFYALGGNETLWFQAAYSLPLFSGIDQQLGFLYLDKLYLRLYADGAMAWNEAWPGLSEVRKDIGAELRLGLGSFYLLPAAVFLSGTYGLDTFDFQLDEGFVTPDGLSTVRYGNELLWHFGLLFEFDL